MPLYDRVADLPLKIEGYALNGLSKTVSLRAKPDARSSATPTSAFKRGVKHLRNDAMIMVRPGSRAGCS